MRGGMVVALVCLVGGVAAGDEPRALEYGGLAEKRVWTVDIAEEGEWWYPDWDRGKSVEHLALVVANDPKLGPPAHLGVFLAKKVAETESKRNGKGKLVVEPPNSRTTSDEVGESKTVKVDTKRGPKMKFLGIVALDARGRWLEARSRGHSSGEAYRIGDLWPELPGKPLTVGLRWKEKKEFRTGFTKEVMLELDVEVVALEKSPEGPVAVLKLRVDKTFARDELDDEQRVVQRLSEGGTGRFILEGTARVRADAPEWLSAEATIKESVLDGVEKFGSTVKVTITLAPKPVLYCDCDEVLAVELR